MIKFVMISLMTMIFSSVALADAPAIPEREISASEQAFLDVVGGLSKEKIMEQFGEPARAEDLTGPDGELIASIWHYDYLNTDDNGEYYKSTELDFMDDKVVTVVFMNTDDYTMPTTK
jgi:hypothetical protein